MAQGLTAPATAAIYSPERAKTSRNAAVRLIQIVPSVAKEASGPSYVLVRLCECLLAQGHEVTLATLDLEPAASPLAYLKAFPPGYGASRLGRSSAMRRWLHDQGRSGTVDVIHNHSLWMMPNVYPGQVARRWSVPLVVSPHGTLTERALHNGSPVKRLFWPLVQKPALQAAACFHASTHSEYADIRRVGFRQPVAVIPWGIDIPNLPPKTPGVPRTLLFLGRIHPIKGLDMLLPAWKAVQSRFPEWQLRIVGPDQGGHLADMQALAGDLELERVVFPGPLLGAQKWQAYAQAELFVLPTYSENFGVAVTEALAAGTPALVSKGAPWESLDANGCGWWVDMGTDALVGALSKAMSRSPAELARMGRLGRDWMARDFSWARIAMEMAEVYAWLTGRGQVPACVRLD